ncbi:odorant receptor 131-2-like [Synchiropus picturatus]
MVSNSSVAVELQSEQERIFVSVFSGVPCVVLLTINAIILFTLRSKQVFRETSRYVLLTNLLVADTLFMMMSQIMYIMANSRVFLTYPVCGTLNIYAILTDSIFPLTLAVMSIERYVAVCFPLRHSSIWAFSCVNVLIRVVLMCQFPFEELDSLDMNAICDTFVVVLTPAAAEYDRVYNILCLSSLIYGLRDQTIRPVLLSNLCCGFTLAARNQIS